MKKTIWFSYQGLPYPGTGPFFYETERYPWVKQLEEKEEVIRKELECFVAANEQKLIPYFNKQMVNGPEKWKALSFKFWNIQFKGNCKACPVTMEALAAIPGLVSASVSLLEPQTEIKAHRGDTTAIVRCHFGINIPDDLPVCGFQVGEEQRSWKNGKTLLFNDAEYHRAWNQTGQRRFILLFDVMHPDHSDKEAVVCSKVVSALLWQYLVLKLPVFGRFSRTVKNTCIYLFSYPCRVFIALRGV
jgi:aspartyl/asparaginyl beta-hydroxylase (cupin superfamily)